MPQGYSSPIRLVVLTTIAVMTLLVVLWRVGSGAATPRAASAVTPGSMQQGSDSYRAGNGVSPVAAATARAVPAAATARGAATLKSVQGAPVSSGGKSIVVSRASGGGSNDVNEGIVHVTRNLAIRSSPGGGTVVGTLPHISPYLRMPVEAWVRKRSSDGRWGLVTVPWTLHARSGWIRLDGLQVSPVNVHIEADLSKRTISVSRGGNVIFSSRIAIGAAGSPSPVGYFWINDPVAVGANEPQYGSYAFGLSALQPHPPRGWTGGNQMAIHGTNSPGSIGTAASAGCLRVSEWTLSRLRTLVSPGTPVTIHP